MRRSNFAPRPPACATPSTSPPPAYATHPGPPLTTRHTSAFVARLRVSRSNLPRAICRLFALSALLPESPVDLDSLSSAIAYVYLLSHTVSAHPKRQAIPLVQTAPGDLHLRTDPKAASGALPMHATAASSWARPSLAYARDASPSSGACRGVESRAVLQVVYSPQVYRCAEQPYQSLGGAARDDLQDCDRHEDTMLNALYRDRAGPDLRSDAQLHDGDL
ncbi:hypothetical protein B0H15DRAFT_957826 [Mycena belliarum]|uniref:Uncharacterized protein n=1 Tax=Mycena belliarum TaxID=1033014 RepID=A0AAD6XGB1_9AGAR|nr:hypothetical protein B0H15DRAFT_957826 [Mycena belliae]